MSGLGDHKKDMMSHGLLSSIAYPNAPYMVCQQIKFIYDLLLNNK